MAQARQLIRGSTAFQEYLAAIEQRPWQNLEEFKVPLIQQREVLDGSSSGTNKLADIDVTSVNSSLLSLLQALTELDPSPTLQWRSSGVRLNADFGTFRNKKREFVAITDGQLQLRVTGKIKALIECKKTERRRNSRQLQMQEVSQIVAWIKEYPDPTIQDKKSSGFMPQCPRPGAPSIKACLITPSVLYIYPWFQKTQGICL